MIKYPLNASVFYLTLWIHERFGAISFFPRFMELDTETRKDV